jgi:hypothetical protein
MANTNANINNDLGISVDHDRGTIMVIDTVNNKTVSITGNVFENSVSINAGGFDNILDKASDVNLVDTINRLDEKTDHSVLLTNNTGNFTRLRASNFTESMNLYTREQVIEVIDEITNPYNYGLVVSLVGVRTETDYGPVAEAVETTFDFGLLTEEVE